MFFRCRLPDDVIQRIFLGLFPLRAKTKEKGTSYEKKDTSLAFGNKVAKVYTTPLNKRATCASALPTNSKFAGAPLSLDFHVVGHFGLHNLIGGAGVAGEDETLSEGGIEAAMSGLGKPDEVFRTVVGGDAVEMVTIVGMDSSGRELGCRRQPFDGSRSDEGERYGMMNEDVAVGAGHLEVLLFAVAIVLVGFGGVEDGFEWVVLKTVVTGCFVFDIDM